MTVIKVLWGFFSVLLPVWLVLIFHPILEKWVWKRIRND
jgi:hypothetical protein